MLGMFAQNPYFFIHILFLFQSDVELTFCVVAGLFLVPVMTSAEINAAIS
jgi:hypothetical protein